MLFHHQSSGAEWLAQRDHAYLGDTPGLGKTRTLLTALKLRAVSRALVVCPAIVRSHWRRENAALQAVEHLVVMSYEEITRGGIALMQSLLMDPTEALVLDEAHYLKSPTAQRTQLLLGRNGYARRIPVVYCASGTPIPRHPGEIWTVLSSLFPGEAIAFGVQTLAKFESAYCVKTGRFVRGRYVEKVIGMKNADRFRLLLSRFLLRRETGAGDTPKIWYQPLTLDAPDFPHQREDEMTPRVDVDIHFAWIADLANTPHIANYRRRVGEAKVAPVVKVIVDRLQDAAEPKIVIFAHHRTVLDALEVGLKEFHPARIDGSTPPTQRERALARFQQDKQCRIFLGQNDACGTGMDGLQKVASTLILVEPNWVATHNVQYANRLARMGQPAPTVTIQSVCLAGTLDEWIIRQNVRELLMQEHMFTPTGDFDAQ